MATDVGLTTAQAIQAIGQVHFGVMNNQMLDDLLPREIGGAGTIIGRWGKDDIHGNELYQAKHRAV
jgi:hypothetical protein